MNEHEFRTLAGLLCGELRSPLTSIIGYSELLLQGDLAPLNNDQTEIVSGIQRVGRRSFHLVQDLYSVMLLRARDRVLERQELEFNTAIANALERAQPALRAAGITMTFERSDTPVVINADPSYIDLLLGHLVWDMVNAPNTPVRIQTSHGERGICIAIQAGHAVAGQTHQWPAPLVAFMVESILTAHGGGMEGGLNREFSMWFPTQQESRI